MHTLYRTPPAAKVSTSSNPAYGQRVAAAVGKWEEEERVRIAGFGVEKLEGSRKESVSQQNAQQRRSRDKIQSVFTSKLLDAPISIWLVRHASIA